MKEQMKECNQQEVITNEVNLEEMPTAQPEYPDLSHYPLALKVTEVAEILHVCRNSVDEMVRSNRIHHVRIGRSVRIPRDAVYDLLHGMIA